MTSENYDLIKCCLSFSKILDTSNDDDYVLGEEGEKRGSGKLYWDFVRHGETGMAVLAQKVPVILLKKTNKFLNLMT